MEFSLTSSPPMKTINQTKPPMNLRDRLKKLKVLYAKNTDQFCKNTSLHGLKYLRDDDLSPRERVYFGLAFVTVVMLACFFMMQIWEKWSTTPVIFGSNPQQSFITQEPFPAITICNLNVAYKSRAEKYSVFSTEYAMLQMLCRRQVNITVADSISDWSRLTDFMTDISQPCTNLLVNCRFGAVKYNCSELFYPIITDEGLCCVFNMVHPAFIFRRLKNSSLTSTTGLTPVPWTSETGYPAKLPKHFSPQMTVGVGESLGLSITLDAEVDEYYCSSLNSIGFKISVQSPMEIPSLREIGLLLPPGLETKVRLSVEKYESEQKLRRIHRRFRQCLFEDEKKLQIFLRYTQANCVLECVSRRLFEKCGCLSYYMPRQYGNESTCSIYESTCVERMRIASASSESNSSSCEASCLPSCYNVAYFPDFFSAPLSHDGFQIANQAIKNVSNSYVEKNFAVVHFYFREHSYRGLKQTEFISGTDVLSSIGGLIGLFFGFSFISLAEFFFYAIIHPFRGEGQCKTKTQLPNPLLNQNSIIQVNPAWKKPVRKHFKDRNDQKFFMNRDIFKSKVNNNLNNQWYNRQQFIV